MKNIIKGQIVTLVSLLAAMTIALAACGGGGSSSAGGSGAIRASTMVTGTVVGGGTASVEFGGAVRMVAALSDLMIETARADDPVNVVVTCGSNEYTGVTGEDGRFAIPVNETANVTCNTSFNGLAGPNVDVSPGMTTEITVSVEGGSVVEVSGPVKTATPGGGTSVAGIADDGSSDGISDGISDSISDDLSEDDISGDDISGDDISDDSTSEDGNSSS